MIPVLFPALHCPVSTRPALLCTASPCVCPLTLAPFVTALKNEIDCCWTQLFPHLPTHKIYPTPVKCWTRPAVYVSQLVPGGEHVGKGKIWARAGEKHELGGSPWAVTFTLACFSFRTGLDCLIHTDLLWDSRPSRHSEPSNTLQTPLPESLLWSLTLSRVFSGVVMWTDLGNISHHLQLSHNYQIAHLVLPWPPDYYAHYAKWLLFEKFAVAFSCTIYCGLKESGLCYLSSEMHPGFSRIWESSNLRIRFLR